MKNRSHGFTLMELMVVLALVAAIMAIGVPSFREFTRNNRMVTMANDFLTGIQVARTEAIKRQVVSGGVALCASNNPDDDNPTCLSKDDTNFNGWVVFVDSNNDCVRDPDKTKGEIVLRTGSRIDTTNTAASYRKSVSNGSCISFAATGFVRADNPKTPNVPVRTVFCDERGNTNQSTSIPLSVARGVEVTATGRARITRDKNEIATWGAVKCE
jgi:prepilin-type N-terminal cleavage/methylation domain-containing protein